MTKKSQAYYRFCHDMSQGKFSYYEPEEIQDAVMDLMDDGNREDALLLAEEGKKQHPDDEEMDKLVIWMYIHNNRTEEAASLFEKYRNDNQDSSLCLKFSLEENILRELERRSSRTYRMAEYHRRNVRNDSVPSVA